LTPLISQPSDEQEISRFATTLLTFTRVRLILRDFFLTIIKQLIALVRLLVFTQPLWEANSSRSDCRRQDGIFL